MVFRTSKGALHLAACVQERGRGCDGCREEAKVEHHDTGGNWITRLVEEMGRAAQAGNAQTARLIALLAVAAAAVAVVVMTSR
jgi:hypothetical protein